MTVEHLEKPAYHEHRSKTAPAIKLFNAKDVDLSEIKVTLRNQRVIDKILLDVLGLSLNQLPSLTSEQAIQALNTALSMEDLYRRLDTSKINLPLKIESLLSQIEKSEVKGHSFPTKNLYILNRGLLEALYPHELAATGFRKALKRFLREHELLQMTKKCRMSLWNWMDTFSLRSPRWKRYLPLSMEPYSATFQSLGKQERIEFCVNHFLPERLDAATLLDLGAGNGYSTRLLTRRFPDCKVTGITINRLELRDARRGGLDMRRADMHALPFPSRFFDWVFAIDIFEHAVAPYIALCEINRILKSGAHAVISYPEGEDALKAWYHFNVLEPWQTRILLYKTRFEVVKEEQYRLQSGLTHANFVIRKLEDHDSKYPRAYEDLNFSE